MLGAIIGDIVGSVYEFNNIRTKDFEFFKESCFITDDTVMTVAVAEALMKYDEVRDIEQFKKSLVGLMHEYGKRYPDMSYGGRFGAWLCEGLTEPYGSFGNGSAMRVAAIVWYARTLDEAIKLAEASAAVTHDHPEGIKGAVCTAGAAYLARAGKSKEEIRDFVNNYYHIDFTIDEIRPVYCFDETCQGTVPVAMQAFFEAENFEDSIRNAISVGGDSDTLAAITGTVAEAYFGISQEHQAAAMTYLDSDLTKLVHEFYKKFPG